MRDANADGEGNPPEGPLADDAPTARIPDIRYIIRESLVITAIVAGAATLLGILTIGCPIKFATGLSCPGCGMSRAWLSFLSLRFDEAFAYHPLFWTVPFLIVAAVASSAGHYSKVLKAALAVMVLSLVVLWAWRLAAGPDAYMFLPTPLGDGSFHEVVGWSEPPWMGWLGAMY